MNLTITITSAEKTCILEAVDYVLEQLDINKGIIMPFNYIEDYDMALVMGQYIYDTLTESNGMMLDPISVACIIDALTYTTNQNQDSAGTIQRFSGINDPDEAIRVGDAIANKLAVAYGGCYLTVID